MNTHMVGRLFRSTIIFIVWFVAILFPVSSYGKKINDSNRIVIKLEGCNVTSSVFITQTTEEPLIENEENGQINWTQGYIIADGLAKIIPGPDNSIHNMMARRSALLNAHKNALKIIEAINLDGDTTIKSCLLKNTTLFYRLKSFIASTAPFKQCKENGLYRVELRIPIYGENSIQSMFLNLYAGSVNKPVAKKGMRIIVDAREMKLQPAIFIKIEDENGNNVYTVKDVSRSVLMKRGMVQYVTTIPFMPDDVIIRALKTDGKQNSNIVISSSDAEKIRYSEKSNSGGKFLTNDVVVLVNQKI